MEKLILALGSDILMDDALSIILAKDLQQAFPDFALEILPVGGLGIIELISGYDLVVIIDTYISADADPGDIIRFDDMKSVKTLHLQNPHDADLYTSLKLAEVTGYRVPERLVIIGVQIKQQLMASRIPSTWIHEKYSQMIEQISCMIRKADY